MLGSQNPRKTVVFMSSVFLFALAVPIRAADWEPNPYSSDFGWFPPLAHYDTNLYVEPIEGLTQARHIAPHEFAVPLGTTVRFRQACDPAARVRWDGADFVAGERTASIAERTMSFVGTFLIRANITKGAERISNVCRVKVVNVPLSAVRVVSVQPVVSPVLAHEQLSNLMTMGYFFGESIAPVRFIRPMPRRGGAKANPSGDVETVDRFHTSINRSILFDIVTTPPGFEPLMEIRAHGHPSVTRSDGPIKFENPGVHRITVGPLHHEKELKIETYRVTILGHDQGAGVIPEGVPVTFQAVTDPPGYEDGITWLTSTKYGTATPVWGHGPTFTAQFDHTFGPDDGFQWLGVKADNTVINQDQKIRPLCELFDDPFLTPSSPVSSITFGGASDIPPIPAGFFGTASGFAGTINLSGVHLAPPGSQFFEDSGMTDTVVTRSGKVECPAGVGMPCNPVDIEIKDISVTAPAPIVVNGVEWLPAMGLSATSQSPGTLQADLLCETGGTYSATLPVLPMFVFARKSHVAEVDAGTRSPEDVEVRILDFGSEPGFDPVMMDLGSEVVWSRTCTPDGGFCANDPPVALDNPPFYPGHDSCGLIAPSDEVIATGDDEIVCAGGGCHGVASEHAHCVCRPQPPPMGRCAYTRLGTREVMPPGCDKCTAPAMAKLAIPCKLADGDACDPGHPCPPYVIAAFRCFPFGRCIAFYVCTGCMG